MKVERYQPRKRPNLPMIACGMLTGILILAGCGIVSLILIIPRLPDLALGAAGFERAGATADLFPSVLPTLPPLVNSVSAADNLVITAGNYGQQTLNPATSSYNLQIGSSGSGAQEMRLSLSENDLLGLCQQYSTICTTAGDQVRNASFDIRTGGMILYGDFYVEAASIYQRAGVVMRFNEFNQLTVNGVDINGSLYTAPPNEIGSLITEAERTANEILRQFTVQSGMETYQLSTVYSDENVITLILR